MAKLSQNQEIQQKLSPKQVLEATVLQLNAQFLEQRILEEIESNPALELADYNDDSFDNEEHEDKANELNELDDKKEEETDFDWEELLGDPDDYDYKHYGERVEEYPDMPLRTVKTISDKFLEQLSDINSSDKELEIAEQILGNLDEHGYLNIEPILISDRMNIEEREVIDVMQKIRYLDPPGFGSRNIRECLISQLTVYNDNKLAMRILSDCFEDFSNRRYEKILDSLECSKNELQEAIGVISQLNPHPGNGIEYSEKDFVIPDLCMEEIDGEWSIMLNDSSLSELKISPSYRAMIEKHHNDLEVKQFVKKKIESANWFIDAIEKRKQTIVGVMESILKRQSKFFSNDRRQLVPMVLKDVANDLSIDVSTVSRVTNGRFVQLPWEIKELKTFFSEGIETEDGRNISNTIVRDRVKQIIESEDKQNPLGDEAIARQLNDEGYKIARRTVTKYREYLKYPVSRLRRELE